MEVNERLTWDATRDAAIREYGEAPADDVSEELGKRYAVEPLLVANAIARVARDETVRSPWTVVEFRTRSAMGVLAASEAGRRALQVEKAERWLREVGFQYPRHGCMEELFGRNGKLEQWAEDKALWDEMTALWQSLQVDSVVSD